MRIFGYTLFRDSHSLEDKEPSVSCDIHCHLLPDWDDGPRTLEQSLQMARRAADNHIRGILVTPHVGRELHGIVERPAHEIPQATESLQQQLRANGIELELTAGAE